MNLWPLFLFFWKMIICHAALIMNKAKKTAVIGTSTFFLGVPPSAQTVAKYGPPRLTYTKLGNIPEQSKFSYTISEDMVSTRMCPGSS